MLLDLLKEHGISRVQLAKDSGVARSTLEAWAGGDVQPEPGTLRRLAAGLRARAQLLLKLADQIDRSS